MPKYEIIASNRYSDKYIVTAKNSDEAREAVYDEDAYPDAVVDQIDSDCVGSDIIDCELIEEAEKCTHSWERVDSCGAYVCSHCTQHANVNRETQQVIQTFVRCICGWAQDGGNGRQQLIEMGENLEEDY
jgi:hypothetical protein